MTATDVRARLITLGLVSSSVTSGAAWACLIGGLTDHVNAPQVAILETTGLPPLDAHGGVSATRPAFQLLVRGAENTYDATATKAQAIFDALHGSIFAGMRVTANTNPAWLGFTPDRNEPLWSLNFTTLKP